MPRREIRKSAITILDFIIVRFLICKKPPLQSRHREIHLAIWA
jgi:hypothetical protein